jgi:sulfite reductase (NADPH) flavoprotein alpha-component
MMSSSSELIFGTIVDRYCLNKPGSSRETWHIVIDTCGTHVPFRPGDSIGVWPKNPQSVIRQLIAYFHLHPEETIVDPRTKESCSVFSFLEERVDLNRLSPRLIQRSSEAAISHEDRRKIEAAITSGTSFEEYDVPHFLQTFVSNGIDFTEIISGLVPISPRLYSISSGPTLNTQRIELTVARVKYECQGSLRFGLCSNYLITSPSNTLPLRLFHQPSRHFIFPTAADIPLVMVGSGTGIAPFRAFMQEVEIGAARQPDCWLFFGERKRTTDFFYEEFWTAQVNAGRLRLDLAFSQDQEYKIYVQHRMWERKKELWNWLENGAIVFVCGNAKTMAKDVDQCLAHIAEAEGNLSSEEALRFLRALRHQKRYLRDIY